MPEIVVSNLEPFSPVDKMSESSLPRSAKIKVVNPFERALSAKKLSIQRPRTETFDTQETSTTANSTGLESPKSMKGSDSVAKEFSSPIVSFDDTCSNKSSTFRTVGNTSLVAPKHNYSSTNKCNSASNLQISGIQLATSEATISPDSEVNWTTFRNSAIPLPRPRADNTSAKSNNAPFSGPHGGSSPRSSQPPCSPRSPSINSRKSSALRDSDQQLSSSLTLSYSSSAEVAPTLNPSLSHSQAPAAENFIRSSQSDNSGNQQQESLGRRASTQNQSKRLSDKAEIDLSYSGSCPPSRSNKLKGIALSHCNPKSGCMVM